MTYRDIQSILSPSFHSRTPRTWSSFIFHHSTRPTSSLIIPPQQRLLVCLSCYLERITPLARAQPSLELIQRHLNTNRSQRRHKAPLTPHKWRITKYYYYYYSFAQLGATWFLYYLINLLMSFGSYFCSSLLILLTLFVELIHSFNFKLKNAQWTLFGEFLKSYHFRNKNNCQLRKI